MCDGIGWFVKGGIRARSAVHMCGFENEHTGTGRDGCVLGVLKDEVLGIEVNVSWLGSVWASETSVRAARRPETENTPSSLYLFASM
jgi:hypothetical protein